MGATSSGGNTPAPGTYPGPNQQVAPLTGQQTGAMNLVSSQTGPAQIAANTALGENANIAGGSLLENQGNNSALQSYYNTLAQPLIQNYQTATMPNILGTAAATGTESSPNTGQAINNANSTLGQSLADLGSQLGESTYGTNVNATLNAQANNPALVSGSYTPAQQLAESGQIQQNQAQNVLNAQYNNAYNSAMWPYQELQMLGQGLGLASGGAGTSTSFGSASQSGSGGMK